MTKKIHVDRFVFLPLHIYRRHLSPPVRKTCPIPNLPLTGENIIIFKKNVLIWKHGKHLQDLHVQTTAKILQKYCTCVTFGLLS